MTKLKRTYSIAVDEKTAEFVEMLKKTSNKSYTEIFVDAFNEKYRKNL